MAKQTVAVCWTPAQSTMPYSFLDGAGSPYVNGTMPITAPTTFTFVPSKACSDSSVWPFTLQIAPAAAGGDITVIIANGPSVSFDANYKFINQRDLINMTLHTDEQGGRTFVIDSGKPIIRNDPHRTFNPVYVIAGILVLAALAYLLWRQWRTGYGVQQQRARPTNDLPGE